ncbi:MAG TPA: phosphatidate cytidylyltransferase [Pseudolysinimonas sp.]|nr:phosphatidate cytidylyltransferase [Pseudolysinimonas sp.]
MPPTDDPSQPPAPAPAKHHDPRAEFEAQVRATKAQFDATNERITQRTGRNLPAAIGIGIVLGGFFLVSLIILKWLFIPFGAALIGFTVFELTTALRFAGRDVPRVASTVVGVAVAPLAFFFHVQGLWIGTLGAIVVITLWRLAELLRPSHRTGAKAVLLDIGAGAFVQVYVTFMAGFYLVLTGTDGGQWWTLASIVTVVATDTGAYATGLAFGRHKLAPTISPGKTWEGFAGSIVAAIVAGVLLTTLMLHQPWWLGVIIGVLLALVGTSGDLTESLIKRDLGIKDISSFLPGHGGFLDRLDSILPSAAVAYAIFFVVSVLTP